MYVCRPQDFLRGGGESWVWKNGPFQMGHTRQEVFFYTCSLSKGASGGPVPDIFENLTRLNILQIGLQRCLVKTKTGYTVFRFLAQRGVFWPPSQTLSPLCVCMCVYISGLKEVKGAALGVCGDLIILLQCATTQPAATFYHCHMLREVVTTVINLYWRWQVKPSPPAADLPGIKVHSCKHQKIALMTLRHIYSHMCWYLQH